MKKEAVKKIIPLSIILIVIILSIYMFTKTNKDTIKYNGNTYVLLEYNKDIFTYNINRNNYYEEDIIHPISHDKWDIIYFNGDLFIKDNQVKKATNYYKDDNNYNWYIEYENNDETIKKELPITKKELDYLYNIEDIKNKETITFDEIEMFIDIKKESNDELIFAITTLIKYNDSIYWKTEIMNENDEEYIIKLPKSLNDKIIRLLNK